MEKKYYVNKHAQANGDHEVHTEECTYLPLSENRSYLGVFTHCLTPVNIAKLTYPTADGCKVCCPACHTR